MSQDADIHMTSSDQHKQALELIENLTTNAAAEQSQVLSTILLRNADTEYLRRYHLNGRTDRESFKKCLPVIEYEELLPDIERISDGDTSPILCVDPISEFYARSGTSSGKRKLIPTTQEYADLRALFVSCLVPVKNKSYLPGLNKGKAMSFLSVRPETKTPGGLLVRHSLTSYCKSPQFQERYCGTSPLDVVLCCDPIQSMYCYLLCGILQNDVVLQMGALFPNRNTKCHALPGKTLEIAVPRHSHGGLNNLVTDCSVKEAITKVLHPNAPLADFVEAGCLKGSWEGIIARLWPNAKYIETIVTGSMAQYIPALDYYSAGLPLVSKFYASSECPCGLNLNPLCSPWEIAYTLMPNMAYFEFLRIHPDRNKQRLLDLVEVEVGQQYELVLITYTGLYRYRVGDVLQVTGFHNAAPQFQFVCRNGVVLSIDADKTGEVELQNAVNKSVEHLKAFNARLVEYTSFADTTTFPGHYVLFWEIQAGSPLPPSVFEDCCVTMEESLNNVYKEYKVSENTIGPLEVGWWKWEHLKKLWIMRV